MNETLNNSPELFKYFNNGISILCDSINKLLLVVQIQILVFLVARIFRL